MNSKSGISKTQATSVAAFALALLCARTYIPEISEKLRAGKVEPPAWPGSEMPQTVLPTQGIERVSPRTSCNEASYTLKVTTSGDVAADGGTLLSQSNCFETSDMYLDAHDGQDDRDFARELLTKHRSHEQQVQNSMPGLTDIQAAKGAKESESDQIYAEEVANGAKDEQSTQALITQDHYAELRALAVQSQSNVHQPYMKTALLFAPSSDVGIVLLGLLALLGSLIFYKDVEEEVHRASQQEIEIVGLSGECVKRTQEKTPVTTPVAMQADMAAQDPQQCVECFDLAEEECSGLAEIADSYDIDWASIETKPHAASCELWPCKLSHLQGFMHAAIVAVSVVIVATATVQVQRALGAQDRHQDQPVDDELMQLAGAREYQSCQLSNGMSAVILSIFAVVGGVVFSSDMQDALDEEGSETCSSKPSKKEVKKGEDDRPEPQAQAPALWPCTPFHLQGLIRSAIVVVGVVGLAFMISQLRGAVGLQSPVEIQSVDDELIALSAKHLDSRSPSSVTLLFLSIFLVLGTVVFSFDVQDALEEEASETRIVEPVKKEDNKVEDDEHKSDTHTPALWPCTPLCLRGLIRSATVVVGVVSLALVISQLRAAMALQSPLEVQSVDDELMALSAKHLDSQSPSGVTLLFFSIFVMLGSVVFGFDVQGALEEETSERDKVEPTKKEVNKVEDDEHKPDTHSPALWPCKPSHLRGLIRSAIVVVSVVSLALVISQLRGAVASQSPIEIRSVDDELMALSAKHLDSQSPSGATLLFLGIFIVLGTVVFTFDVQDVLEEETSEPKIVEPSTTKFNKVEDDKPEAEAQCPALWPCAPLRLRGLIRSSVVLLGIVSLAFLTSQVRGALASQREPFDFVQMDVQATAQEELVALSAKHQGSHLPCGAAALILGISVMLGGAIFTFDTQEALKEEAGEPCKETQ